MTVEVAKTEIPAAEKPAVKYTKVEKKSGKRIGFNYIIIKSLRESSKNDVVKCFYIKGLTKFGFCVIKEGTSGDVKDKQGRDIKDRLIWQERLHKQLQDKIRMPRLLGSFEENGNYYLVIEFLKGKSLYEKMKKDRDLRRSLLSGSKSGIKFISYLEQMVEILLLLHANGIVHRDVTPANFMVLPEGKVAIIDMELSYSVEERLPSPPFQLGTYGYMSPQQEITLEPTVKEDVYSVGAILLQTWSLMSARKLSGMEGNDLKNMVYYFIPDNRISDLVIRCLDKDASIRPGLKEILDVIHKFRIEREEKRPIVSSPPPPVYTTENILETVQAGIHLMGSTLMADTENGWFAERMGQITRGQGLNKAYYASLSHGVSGILYFLSRAMTSGFDITTCREAVKQGVNLIQSKYLDNFDRTRPGLHLGSDGVALALSTALRTGIISDQTGMKERFPLLLQRDCERYGIINGLAGQGIASILCYPGETRAEEVAEKLLSLQSIDGSWQRNIPCYDFGNGMAGIIYFLLQFGKVYNSQKAVYAACAGIRFLLEKPETGRKSLPRFPNTGRPTDLSWSEGVAGMSLAFIKAFEVTEEPVYKELALRGLQGHDISHTWRNLSQLQGLAGLGEIYLEACETLKEEQFFHKACEIMQFFMHTRRKHLSDQAYWLVEKEPKPVANLMVGNSGILHFLMRGCFPGKFGFPGLS